MSEQSQLPAVQAKNEIEFKPFGSDDAIRLSLNVIKTYVAVPAHDRNTKEEIAPDERECMRFMMLCRTQRLNPFAGDAFMVPFWDGRENRYKWNLITGITAFYKRAELHPEFDGIESGVIVEDELGEIAYLEGDFIPDGQKCVGGWATVFFKHRSHPMKKKVKLSTYQKTFGVWTTDAPGMICKVAEAQGLRDAFPTMLGGMYLREEYTDIPAEVLESREIRRPDFAQALPPVSIDQQQTRKTEKTLPKAPEKTPEKTPQGESKAQSAPPTPSEPSKAAVQSPASSTTPPSGTPEPPKAPEKAPEPPKAPETPAATPTDDDKAEAAMGLAPATPGEPAANVVPGPFLTPTQYDDDAAKSIQLLAAKSNVSGEQLEKWLRSKRLLKPEQKSLMEMSLAKRDALARTWNKQLPDIRAGK